MKNSWVKITLFKKIVAPGIVLILIFTAGILGYLIPEMRENIIDEKKKKLQEITETAIGIFKHFDAMIKEDKLTLEEAQKAAMLAVKDMKFGPEGKDYLWINDFQPKMIMHPWVTQLDGKDLNDYKDPNGFRLFVAFADECRKNGKGFVPYMWQWKDQKDKIVPKISFVQAYDPWKWIVGTGMYIEDVNQQIRKEIQNILIFLGIVVGFFILIIIATTRSVVTPLKESLRISQKVADGDLTMEIIIKSRDETGQLQESMKIMTTKLSGIVTDILECANDIARASEELNSTAQNMSQGSSEQAANVEEIASSLEEMGATVSMNTENARNTDLIAQKTAENAEEGGRVVNETVAAMKSIAEKINLIDDVAYQTNLLALNAAIEAARAGEHGKGFAVVASEVRKLAERTQVASLEIGELAKNSVHLADKAGKLLDEIVPNIKKTADLVQNITNASEQQDAGISQINSGMQQLNQITQQNASASEQLASTSEILSSSALRLQKMMEFFNTGFKIKEKSKSIDIKELSGIKGKDDRAARELKYTGNSGNK